jgi:dTMP kinase
MGLLIAIEGDDYVGKTTVAVPGLRATLSDCGFPVLVSREPGGSPEAEQIRQEIFTKAQGETSQEELARLFNKARRIHLEQVIKPFLGEQKEKQGVVILDRYMDSTRVYQGLEGKLPMETIYELEKEFVGGYFPDLTFILYFPKEKMRKMMQIRQQLAEEELGSEHRDKTVWDESTIEVHEKRQEYYLQLEELAKKHGERRYFNFIDASLSPFEIIQKLTVRTGEFLNGSEALALPNNFISAVTNSLNKLRASLFFIQLERQWKKQQALLEKQGV